MKQNTLSMLAIALMAVLATACNRETADTTAGTEPIPATEPAPATTEPSTPEPSTTMPADTTAGTTAGTTTGTTAATEPTTTTPPTTMGDAGTSFTDMDKNRDGNISQDELPANDPLRQTFSTADTNGDGKLSSSEFDAQRATTMPPGG